MASGSLRQMTHSLWVRFQGCNAVSNTEKHLNQRLLGPDYDLASGCPE